MSNQNIKDRLSDEAGESRLLSSILRHGLDAFIEIEGIVQTNTMTCEATQVLWHCIEEFFGVESVKPTIASIIKYSKALGYTLFDSKNEKDWLVSLFNLPTEIQDTKILGTELRRLQFKRELHDVVEIAKNRLIQASTLSTLSEISSSVTSPIDEFLMKVALGDNEGDYLTKDSDIYLANLFDNPNTVTGYDSGYPKFNDFAGGSLEPETLHVIAARLKVGKSSFALNVAMNLGKKGIHTIIEDTEMNQRKWLNRFLSNLTKINIRKFKQASFSEEEKDKINDAMKVIKEYPIIYLNVNGKTLDESIFCTKRLLNKKVGKNAAGKYDCLFIYDYIKINDSADVSDSVKEYQALGFHANKLKNFAIKEKIPILTFTQQNREAVDGKNNTKSISGSDRIGWVCDSLTAFVRKTTDEMNEDRAAKRKPFNRKMILMESRDAAEVDEGVYINYRFDGSIAEIEEGPTNVEINNHQPQITTTEADKQTEF